MSALMKKAHTLIVVPRFVPTTQLCSNCGSRRKLGLGERTYSCSVCGLSKDRDLNAALNILNCAIPEELRESTPVDTKTATEMMRYFNGISYISARLVDDAGSPLPLGGEVAHL